MGGETVKQLVAGIAIVGVALMARPASADPASSVNNAYRLCAVFDQMGLLSDKCSVSGWSSAVDISVDTTAIEAHKICAMSANFAHQHGIAFDGGWQLRIYSPFSAGNTVAVCSL